MKKLIYLDHSATTPVDNKVLAAIRPYFDQKFGNPSSLHSYGQEAQLAVDQARQKVAKFLNCQSSEIIFTSGATEADNLAIYGVARALAKKNKTKLHLISSSIEHAAALEPMKDLANQGLEVTFLPVNANGLIKIEDFKKAVKENTVFVSIMYVNSEVGSSQPLREIGKMIEKINQARLKKWQQAGADRQEKPLLIYFHTDAVQAVNFLNCDTKYLHLDLLSLSGHKIYGPKGVGALFVKTGTPIQAVQLGGHHEQNIRSGTLNVTGIVGLAAAIGLLTKEKVAKNNEKIARLRNLLVQGILKNIPDVILNTDMTCASPAHAHFSFLGAEGEAILIALDLAGIAVSTGSACAAGDLKPSHVLLAMGMSEAVAHSSIRFSLGKNNTQTEIEKVIKVLPTIIKRLRKMSPKL